MRSGARDRLSDQDKYGPIYIAAAAIAREPADAEIARLTRELTRTTAERDAWKRTRGEFVPTSPEPIGCPAPGACGCPQPVDQSVEIARLRQALSDARRVAVSDLHSDRALVSIINRIDAALNNGAHHD